VLKVKGMIHIINPLIETAIKQKQKEVFNSEVLSVLIDQTLVEAQINSFPYVKFSFLVIFHLFLLGASS
jgi:hypothetical protein